MLAGLRHRAVGGRHDQDRAVHLRRAGDHVLHIVGVAGAVDVRVVTVGRLVFDVRRRDRDAARLLFRRLVDLVVGRERRAAGFGQHLRDRRRQRRLAMVDVTDRADVAVRLVRSNFSLAIVAYLISLFRDCYGRKARLRRTSPEPSSASARRHLLVVVELHGEVGAALGEGAQLVHVAEHVGERHHGVDDVGVAAHVLPWIWPRREFRSPMTEPM